MLFLRQVSLASKIYRDDGRACAVVWRAKKAGVLYLLSYVPVRSIDRIIGMFGEMKLSFAEHGKYRGLTRLKPTPREHHLQLVGDFPLGLDLSSL